MDGNRGTAVAAVAFFPMSIRGRSVSASETTSRCLHGKGEYNLHPSTVLRMSPYCVRGRKAEAGGVGRRALRMQGH